jgi:hypothetical protein
LNTKETKTTGIEPYIIDCMCMNFDERQALSYLSDKGYDISRAEYYSLRKEIKESTQQRLNLVASEEFMAQHIERIDMLKTIQKEMWTNYHLEKNPSKRADILMEIAELQQYLSAFYDSSSYVMERAAIIRKRKKELTEQEQQ